MKKLFLLCAITALSVNQSYAQRLDAEDFEFFNHLSAGISMGTDGVGIEVAAPLTYDFAVRAGYTFVPKVKINKSVDLKNNDGTIPGAFLSPEVDLEAKINMGDFKMLFDWYPFRTSSFHATAGFYIGKGKLVDLSNKKPFVKDEYKGIAGIELGDPTKGSEYRYTMFTDQNGDVKAEVDVNSFKPYLGVGFGRVVPKGRVGVQFDLGVQFWGSPEVLANMNYVDRKTGEVVTRYEKIKKNRIINEKKDYQDLKDGVNTIQKVGVYPVLTLRINGRIF